MATIVTIGLTSNRTLKPLPAHRAVQFASDIRALFTVLYVDGAQSRGQWQDERTGTLITEDSLTWIGEAPDITRPLRIIAAMYEQDAIACTVGETALVNAANTVAA
jgi:hypothetical protein